MLSFCADHGLRFAYMTGAHGQQASPPRKVVTAAARATASLDHSRAAGQALQRIEAVIDRLELMEGGANCFNLIHSPNESGHEAAVVELYLRRGIHLVEAAAFLDLSPSPPSATASPAFIAAPDGQVVTPNQIIAKVSRTEVATKWFTPPPPAMLEELTLR